MTSSYQPFLIGKFSTGLFNYLQPWQSPEDSFRELVNSYIFRGVLSKRSGYYEFGRMAYSDSSVIATGDGGSSYSGTLPVINVRPASFIIRVNTSAGIETFTSDAISPTGTLTGNLGDTGSITWATGAWSITLSGGRSVTNGVEIWGTYTYVPTQQTSPVENPIMFIETFFDEETDQRKMLVCDTRRACVYNGGSNRFDPISSINQLLYTTATNTSGSPVVITPSIDTGWIAISPATNGLTPYSISITDGTSTITDDGSGNLSSSGNFQAGGTVNYATGVISLNYSIPNSTTTPINITLSANLVSDYFTGNDTNFFNGTNWLGNLYFTNNVDRITTFDGSTLARPFFSITQADFQSSTNDVATCLEIEVYKNRLLLLRPKIAGEAMPDGQSIRWSAVNQPTNLIADVAGNGGELSAPTDDWIQSEEFLRDQLVVNFEETTWLFRYTGNNFDPFRWDKINSSKSCNAPYGTVPYDDRTTAMGVKGLVACDGVNVDRYDLNIVDSFLDDINKDYFEQCYGVRFDSPLNQTWMLYPSNDSSDTDHPEKSDRALIYNFLENTWATYNLSMSCLGIFYESKDATWDDFAVGGIHESEYPNWESAEVPWDYFLFQSLSPSLFGGGHTGIIYQMDSGPTDNGTDISSSAMSTRWNPFAKMGQRTTFGYIDFYYKKTDQENPVVLTLDFFTNNSSNPALTRTLTLDGPLNSDSAMKRIYLSLNGEFIQMKITNSNNGPFEIYGMVLWASPSGRFTPGLSV